MASRADQRGARGAWLPTAAAAGVIALLAGQVQAAPRWWLPANYSVHGREIDALFNWIFAICTLVLVGVMGALAYVLVRYRHRDGRRAAYTHGNPRLELIWTAVPAAILGVIAVASTRVWSSYRYAAEERPAGVKPAKILVIGEQFKWNIIYPGPDGKFGRYLVYPQATDAKWPGGVKFQGYAGPRDVPPEKVGKVLQQWMASSDAARLGKDMDDPDGQDDLYAGSLGRVMEVPLGRPVDVTVGSKDVIHSFSLPNFRVKLDTVPGLKGLVSFTVDRPEALASEREKASRETLPIEEVRRLLAAGPANAEWRVHIDEASEGADKDKLGWRYSVVNPHGKSQRLSIIRDGGAINYAPDDPATDTLSRLAALGVKRLTVYRPGYFDIVCQELCGQGHYTMQGEVRVITNDEYVARYESKAGE